MFYIVVTTNKANRQVVRGVRVIIDKTIFSNSKLGYKRLTF